MKKLVALLSFIIVLVVGCADNTIESNTEDLSQASVHIKVDDTTAREETVYFEDGDKLLEVMREHFDIETEESDYGNHIVSIDGYDVRELEDGGSWEYSVNNVQSTTTEANQALSDGDTVEWVLWAFE